MERSVSRGGATDRAAFVLGRVNPSDVTLEFLALQ